MILSRVETETKIEVLYESSNIIASIYDKSSSDLEIVFKRGARYKYKSVRNTDYFRFETAESQGTIMESHIKKYDFEKLSDIETSKLITEIKNKIEVEKDIIKSEILLSCQFLLDEYKNNNNFSNIILEQLLTQINKLKAK
jgi:hypothetical protein